jgi:cytochrome c oxidase subunit III
MSVPVIGSHQFQYGSTQHQSDAAISGMWLFLVTETLFFGALFLTWIFCRHLQPAGFDAGARASDIVIGSINTALLVSSSMAYAFGLACLDVEAPGAYRVCLLVTLTLGIAFLALKGVEWHEDFGKHLFPGPGFNITGADAGGAQLFFSFYFIGTALHAVHMLGGIGLVGWMAARKPLASPTPSYRVAAENIGLYWSFVDMVWLVLYPLIYLIGRGS